MTQAQRDVAVGSSTPREDSAKPPSGRAQPDPLSRLILDSPTEADSDGSSAVEKRESRARVASLRSAHRRGARHSTRSVGSPETEALGDGADLVDDTTDRLRCMIVRGELRPGDRLVELDVCQRMGVSRTPVRSALHRLREEGLVIELVSGRRNKLAVAPVAVDDAFELLEIVGQLEGLAAATLAQKDRDERGKVIAVLRTLSSEVTELAPASAGDRERFVEIDLSFHQKLVASAGPKLRAAHGALHSQVERYQRLFISGLAQEVAATSREHQDVLRAVEWGKPEHAEQAMKKHWRASAKRLREAVASRA